MTTPAGLEDKPVITAPAAAPAPEPKPVAAPEPEKKDELPPGSARARRSTVVSTPRGLLTTTAPLRRRRSLMGGLIS
jgi:hypothetical protein